jgi:predicted acetyltransferase
MNGRMAKKLRKMARQLWEDRNLEKDIPFKSFYRKIKKQYVRRNNE